MRFVPGNKRKTTLLLSFVYLLLGLFYLPYWQSFDEQLNDYWRAYIADRSEPDQSIIIVDIDDQSLTSMQSFVGKWPWPRSIHAQVIDALQSVKPKAIVFDIIFSEFDLYRPADDQYFKEVLAEYNNIFLSAVLLPDTGTFASINAFNIPQSMLKQQAAQDIPIPVLLPNKFAAPNTHTGLINFLADDDAVARRYPLSMTYQDLQLKSLPVVVAETLSDNIIPGDNYFRLKYMGTKSIPYLSVSYADLWLMIQKNDLQQFTNKIVFIGTSATGLHDLKESPFGKVQPAITILATAVDNLLNQDTLAYVPIGLSFILTLFLCVLIHIALRQIVNYRKQILLASVLVLLGITVIAGTSWYLSQHNGLFHAFRTGATITFFTMVIILVHGVEEFLARQHTQRVFNRFLDPAVVSDLISQPDWQDSVSHSQQEISVLFSDIRGFTTLSESRAAEEILTLLNQYFEHQVDAIFKHQGTLDKFIGDAVMAFWGAPVPQSDHAQRAIFCALEMVENLQSFKATLPEDLQHFDVGIGIHSGNAVVGLLGSHKRIDYTAIGDTVNLASRVEGVTKGVARILVSEQTKNLCEGRFDFTFRGEYQVKGREEPVKLFEPQLIGETHETN